MTARSTAELSGRKGNPGNLKCKHQRKADQDGVILQCKHVAEVQPELLVENPDVLHVVPIFGTKIGTKRTRVRPYISFVPSEEISG